MVKVMFSVCLFIGGGVPQGQGLWSSGPRSFLGGTPWSLVPGLFQGSTPVRPVDGEGRGYPVRPVARGYAIKACSQGRDILVRPVARGRGGTPPH